MLGITSIPVKAHTLNQTYLVGHLAHGEVSLRGCENYTVTRTQNEYSQSPSDLWNYCQSSPTKHGELHNNLRMTWGKAIPYWTESLDKSLHIAQKLNDKYALDEEIRLR